MKDEDLLRAITAAARRDPARERAEAWERVASGEATPEEAEALEALAREEGEGGAREILAPLGDRLEESVLSRIAADRARPPAKVVALRGRVAAAVGALAIAAGLALAITRVAPPSPLPSYDLDVSGGLRDTRGPASSPSSAVTLGPDSQLTIVMRPAHDVPGPIEARGAIVRDGSVDAWSPPFTFSPTGVVGVSGLARELVSGPNGARDLVLVIGRPGDLPSDASSIAASSPSEKLRVFRAHVEIVGR